MGFFKKLKELILLDERDDNTTILLVTSDYINEDDFSTLADYIHDGFTLIFDMASVDPYIGARCMEYVCGATRARGGYGYAMGSNFYIHVPVKGNYKVLCKEKYEPEKRKERGGLILLK